MYWSAIAGEAKLPIAKAEATIARNVLRGAVVRLILAATADLI
jgi:hypothetical protein